MKRVRLFIQIYAIIGVTVFLGLSSGCSEDNTATSLETPPEVKPVSRPAETQPAISDEDAKLAKLLTSNLDDFTLVVKYFPPRGGKQSEYPSLTLRVSLRKDKRPANWQAVRISKEQAESIIKHLAATGWLRRAECVNNPMIDRLARLDPVGPIYVLNVFSGGWEFEEQLALDAELYCKLQGLRNCLDGSAARAIDVLLERLKPFRGSDKI